MEEEKEGGEVGVWERIRRKMDEKKRKVEEKKREEEEKERWRALGDRREEQIRRERRSRNLVWREIEGRNLEERGGYMRVIMEKLLGREVELRGVEERLGEGGRRILLVVMEREEDKEEIMERREEI